MFPASTSAKVAVAGSGLYKKLDHKAVRSGRIAMQRSPPWWTVFGIFFLVTVTYLVPIVFKDLTNDYDQEQQREVKLGLAVLLNHGVTPRKAHGKSVVVDEVVLPDRTDNIAKKNVVLRYEDDSYEVFGNDVLPKFKDNGFLPEMDSDLELGVGSSDAAEVDLDLNDDADMSVVEPGLRGRLTVLLRIYKAGGSMLCYAANFNGETTNGSNCNAATKHVAQGSADRLDIAYDRLINERGLTFIANEWMLSNTLPDRDEVSYVTMLRDPLARMEAHYRMAMEQAQQRMRSDPYKWRCRYANGIPTDRQLGTQNEDPKMAARARIYFAQTTPDNWQTRALCGPPCAQVPYGQLTKDHLELAKMRLSSVFDVVGILEHFDETLTLMHDHLHWNKSAAKDFSMQKRNFRTELTMLERVEQGLEDEPLMIEFAKWYHATNQLDIEVYNLARVLFKAQAEARGIPVDLGAVVRRSFIVPGQPFMSSRELKAMLATYVRENTCATQCCTGRCGPMGLNWSRDAELLKMVPQRKSCSRPSSPGATSAFASTQAP